MNVYMYMYMYMYMYIYVIVYVHVYAYASVHIRAGQLRIGGTWRRIVGLATMVDAAAGSILAQTKTVL